MSSLTRLHKILSVVARYGLAEFLPAGRGRLALQTALLPYRVLGVFSRDRSPDKNTRLRRALEELGPIYIKLGQLVSTRRDFLDAALADELQGLQDDVPPFPMPPIEQVVESALGAPADRFFSQLDSEPLAAASIAQVYGAQLLDGSDVIIKVVRPGIERVVRQDIRLLKRLARLVEGASQLGKRLRPIEVINDYEKIILDELNLQNEAANTTQLRRQFEGSNELYIPKIYWDFTNTQMLVMERIDGIPVADVDALNARGVDLKHLAEAGVNIFFTQVFEHNFFHADMHPGNIFVAKTGSKPHYIAIDCAIIGSLTDDDQDYLAKNLLAIFKQDYRRVAELHIACGWVPATTRVHEFESAIRSVCEPIFEKPLSEISFGQILVQLFATAGRFDMQVQPSLVLLQKTLLNVEGLGRQLYPQLDLWQTALPFLERWNAKRLSPLTLLAKLKDNLPDLLEQLPNLPQLLASAGSQSKQLAAINATLSKQQATEADRRTQARRSDRLLAALIAAATLASLTPASREILASAPALPVIAAVVLVAFLCFRR
ncbi:MAG: ubiquinone biosynthesis regulatory protein kinase UbiB [Gammaproteobacteria bacterium]|nr:ubiquinone biosynthesis regulatory protein kinase UbiB [Gammaproteobacteria bacterium]